MNRPSPPAEHHPAERIWRSPLRQLLVLAGLAGFAISQPILGLLGDEPTILARHGIEGRELVLLAIVVAFVPPLVLWIPARVVAAAEASREGTRSHERPPRLARVLHLVAVGALVGCFAIQVAKAVGLARPAALLLAASLAAAGFVAVYVRNAAVATWASYTAILPFLAVGSFLVVSPASALLTSAPAPERVVGAGDLPSVVLVILDELPTRSLLDAKAGIDAERFPNLAGFAEDATWYRHSSSVATLTEAAVPSLLTGNLPVAEEAVWTNHPDNLFTILAPTHELEVIEQATELCPYDVCVPTAAEGRGGAALEIGGPGFGDVLGIARDLWFDRVSLGEDEPPDLDDFAESITPTEPSTTTTLAPTSPSVTARPGPEDRPTPNEGQALTSVRTQALIDSFDASKDPALYYLHLMIPHQPFKRYADGTEYQVVDPLGVGLPEEDRDVLFSWSPWTSTVNEQQHLLQAQYGDQLVGQILDGLRDAGLYDDSLVIVASDHGISFEARTASRYVEPSTTDAIAYAPLLVKPPGQTDGAVDDTNVMTIDLLPTIAEILGIELPAPIDGAAVGSDAIAARGSAKRIYDMSGFGGLRIRKVIDFDDRDAFSTVGDSFIGPLTDPDDPLSALHEALGTEDLVGRRFDDVVTGTYGSSVVVDGLPELLDPGEPSTSALVTGAVSGGSDEQRLILAIDGVVVGGSALSTDSDGRGGRIAVLLPQGALEGHNEIRAALLQQDGEVLEVEVRSP